MKKPANPLLILSLAAVLISSPMLLLQGCGGGGTGGTGSGSGAGKETILVTTIDDSDIPESVKLEVYYNSGKSSDGQVFRRIVLGSASSDIFLVSLLVFLFSLLDYSVPSLCGINVYSQGAVWMESPGYTGIQIR